LRRYIARSHLILRHLLANLFDLAQTLVQYLLKMRGLFFAHFQFGRFFHRSLSPQPTVCWCARQF